MILLLLLLFIPAPSWAAFTSVLGVPDPPFGIVETAPARPVPWASDVPGWYYVDGSTGVDAPGKNGNPNNPRKTIPLTLAEGEVVEVHGTYNKMHWGNGQEVKPAGTAARPVWIRGVDNVNMPTFTQPFQVAGTYCIVENIKFTLADTVTDTQKRTVYFGPVSKVDTHHIVLRESEVSGNPDVGGMMVKRLSSYAPAWVHDIVIYHNHIHHNGGRDKAVLIARCEAQIPKPADCSSPDQDMHGVMLNGGVYNVWILENEFNNNSGDATQINGGNCVGCNNGLHHIYFGRNNSHNNKQYGVWTKEASDVIISENTIHDVLDSDSSEGSCLGSQYAAMRIWVLFNHCYAANMFYRNSTDHENQWQLGSWYVIGNLAHNLHYNLSGYATTQDPLDSSKYFAVFSITGDGPVERHIVNNTFYNTDGGINFISFNAHPEVGPAPLFIRNNLFGYVDPTKGAHINIASTTTTGQTTIENNIFNDGVARICWNVNCKTGVTTPRNLTQMRTAIPGWCPGCVESVSLNMKSPNRDAVVFQPAGVSGNEYGSMQSVAERNSPGTYVDWTFPNGLGDYRIQAGSAAINSAAAAPEYKFFKDTYGIDIAVDLDKRVRNCDTAGGFSIGAYEYASGGGPHVCN